MKKIIARHGKSHVTAKQKIKLWQSKEAQKKKARRKAKKRGMVKEAW